VAGNIFINYRRGDDPGFTQALFSHLERAFSTDQLFIDIDGIEPGLDFTRVLADQVAKCDIVLAVIGKSWLDVRDEQNKRRLDNPEDFVRIEIVSALEQDKRVIPILVGNATMPNSDDLPDALKPLARRNAVRLTHDRFKSDTEGLIKSLHRVLESAEQQRQLQDTQARQADDERIRAEAAEREQTVQLRLAAVAAERAAADARAQQARESEEKRRAEQEDSERVRTVAETEAARKALQEQEQATRQPAPDTAATPPPPVRITAPAGTPVKPARRSQALIAGAIAALVVVCVVVALLRQQATTDIATQTPQLPSSSPQSPPVTAQPRELSPPAPQAGLPAFPSCEAARITASPVKNIALLVADTARGRDIAKSARSIAGNSSLTVVTQIFVPLNPSDYSAYLLQAQAGRADVVLNCGQSSASPFLAQSREFGFSPLR
jgi:Periplasmic binding protein/TIR domain